MMRSRICSSNSRGSVARRLVSRIRDRITANWFFTRWFTSRISSRMRRSFSFANVISRAIFDAPTIVPSGVPDRRDGQRHENKSAVLAAAGRLVAGYLFASPDALDDVGFLALQPFGDQHQDRLANSLIRRIAEQTLRGAVPVGDDAVQVLADNGVEGGIDYCRQTRVGVLVIGGDKFDLVHDVIANSGPESWQFVRMAASLDLHPRRIEATRTYVPSPITCR